MVSYYYSDRSLITSLNHYIGAGLAVGDACIVIATPNHIKKLNKELAKNLDFSLDEARNTNYIAVNAEAILADFIKNGRIDKKKFYSIFGQIIKEAEKKGKPIRAYGEMVSVLWENGHKASAIRLEKIWNEIAQKHSFALFCAYPQYLFDKQNHERSVIDICHSQRPALSAA